MANIAEGFERSSDKEFQRLLYMAKGSAGELRSHLVVARALAYIIPEEFVARRVRADELSKSRSGFITYLYGSVTV
jgi:four helix bundle protein